MSIRELYDSIGESYESAEKRLGGEEAVLAGAKRFCADDAFENLKHSMGEADLTRSFNIARNLKTRAEELCFNSFLQPLSALTEVLGRGTLVGAEDLLMKSELRYLLIKKNAENL